jgi:hypothetical protein
MASKNSLQHYRLWYARLLRLYPKSYRDRFVEGMQQTFNDLCRNHTTSGKSLFTFVLWIFFETALGIIRENITTIMKTNKRIVAIFLAVACLLLIPFLGGWPWDETDYIVAGGLLLGTALAYEFVSRKRGNIAYRIASGVALFTALLLVWINLAVGVIGSEDNPANLLYGGVLAVGLVGALIARFQPSGMARALLAMAIAQALVPVIAILIWRPPFTIGMLKVLILNAVFVMLFASSALLFRRASATSGLNQ